MPITTLFLSLVRCVEIWVRTKCRTDTSICIHCLWMKASKLNYLIAATAKDLSLMICFRPRKEKDIEFSFSSVFLKSTNQIFDYKLHPLRLIELYIWIIQHAEDVSHARDSAGELGLRGCRLQLRLGSEGVDRVKGGEGDMG
ncbi:hypothetical protein RHMOL_Rhmol05G0176600 [Rhododendron molle]|uniref:Uncharacterized protein n=1 Tax=Rhododendron molle TaxID=49168 RepID=A0ACC0NSM9_RHOML|nr:hypothetical protein RHMOL_Rhmol05G0176600 [Rhododendron molle]